MVLIWFCRNLSPASVELKYYNNLRFEDLKTCVTREKDIFTLIPWHVSDSKPITFCPRPKRRFIFQNGDPPPNPPPFISSRKSHKSDWSFAFSDEALTPGELLMHCGFNRPCSSPSSYNAFQMLIRDALATSEPGKSEKASGQSGLRKTLTQSREESKAVLDKCLHFFFFFFHSTWPWHIHPPTTFFFSSSSTPANEVSPLSALILRTYDSQSLPALWIKPWQQQASKLFPSRARAAGQEHGHNKACVTAVNREDWGKPEESKDAAWPHSPGARLEVHFRWGTPGEDSREDETKQKCSYILLIVFMLNI